MVVSSNLDFVYYSNGNCMKEDIGKFHNVDLDRIMDFTDSFNKLNHNTNFSHIYYTSLQERKFVHSLNFHRVSERMIIHFVIKHILCQLVGTDQQN